MGKLLSLKIGRGNARTLYRVNMTEVKDGLCRSITKGLGTNQGPSSVHE